MTRRRLFVAFAFFVCSFVFGVRSFAADGDEPWTELAVADSFAAWKPGHRGWSVVGDAALNPQNDRRLVAVDGQAQRVLLSRGDANLYTRDDYQDVEVQLEFLISRGSNSGVKLNGLYEIQIRDTAGVDREDLTGDHCGGVYPRAELGPPYKYLDDGVAPRVNAARPAGEWQTLEIAFVAPRFDGAGKKTADARFVRVVLNGEVVHENVTLKSPTGHAWDEEPEVARGPLLLQGDHGPVAFRNLRVRRLTATTP